MKVFVYFNLRKKVWSIKALEGENKNRVIGHAKGVQIGNVTPKVSQAGRERVLREKQKNVHAGLVGELLCVSEESNLRTEFPFNGSWANVATRGDEVTYNPYKYTTFVHKQYPKLAMGRASVAVMLDRKVYCYGFQCF